jgi:multiple sugar transport system ATP-binding protein
LPDTFAVTHLGGAGAVARLKADANVKAGATTPLAFNMSKSVFFDPGRKPGSGRQGMTSHP